MARKIKRRPYGRKRGWGARIAGWVIRAIFIFIIGSILWVLLYRFVPPPITFTMIGDAVQGRGVTKDWMAIEAIDDDMKRAAIAAEDSKFCAHMGFDQDAIAEAMRRNAQGDGVMRGGSTISQQTAKNAFLWQGGGYFRKGLEAWFTLLIEQMWSKQRIMEVYLNIAETGIGTYGVNAGAQRYFGKDASSLSRTEAARIAAVLPLPKEREAITPSGFTRRYGNSVAARIGVVARDGLDSCLYDESGNPSPVRQEPASPPPAKQQQKETPVIDTPETDPPKTDPIEPFQVEVERVVEPPMVPQPDTPEPPTPEEQGEPE